MVNFCNPGLLGGTSRFHKYFELPIVAGREPAALDEEVALGEERMAELNEIVAEFILRRTNSLLSQHLPPKVEGPASFERMNFLGRRERSRGAEMRTGAESGNREQGKQEEEGFGGGNRALSS